MLILDFGIGSDSWWVWEKGRKRRTVVVRGEARAPEYYRRVGEVGLPGEVDEVVVVEAEAAAGAAGRVEPVDVGFAGDEGEPEAQ